MRIFKGLLAVGAAWAVFGSAAAYAQTSPRIIMRRPLPPVEAAPVNPGQACGQAGQPACPSDCDYVGATWVVGQWQGAACGEDGTVTRSVQCMAIGRNGQRVPKPDAFCLQDAASFASSCGQPIGPVVPMGSVG